MSILFNLRPPVKERPIVSHPWDKTIKDVHSNAKKYAHNSINNPHYPDHKKKKKPYDDIIKFTVIGDRLTTEFIYCVNLVCGLHKYRWRKFDVPEIRGVSSVDWPEVWHGLKVKYGGISHCIQSRVAVLMNDNFLGSEKELKELVEAKYIYHLQLDYCNEAISNFATYIRSSGRPCAYMHISINEEPIGTLIFMLYADLLPYTSDNFLRLCNARKGGYSGTPIHRIVKDGWIQGGGFGLKNTDLGCENFMVPHDKRGVLCMANDGRHVDCSTQFFVLLQPAPWMAHKYVAFGQLIEGEQTLNKIEEQPTWYESPTTNIIIYKAGILNLDCDDITVNKGVNEYIHGHIEDLFALGEMLIEALIQRVFLEAELRLVERLRKELLGEEEEEETGEMGQKIGEGELHRTQRFRRRRETHEAAQKEAERLKSDQRESQAIQGRSQSIKSDSQKTRKIAPVPLPSKDSDHENNDFDVEEYEMEESVYQHMSIVSESLIVKPEKPYYIPLTDVPYPGEKDSTYDLKKFLTGEYCLESDIDPKTPKVSQSKHIKYPSEIMKEATRAPVESESASSESLDSMEEKEIEEYLRTNAENVSYAGSVVRSIARAMDMPNLFQKTDQITEEQLRRVRLASADYKAAVQLQEHDTKVKIDIPDDHVVNRIKRRQTGFVHGKVFTKTESELAMEEEEEEDVARKVRISASATSPGMPELRKFNLRRPTGFVRTVDIDTDSEEEAEERDHRDSRRPSAMQRLYDETRLNYEPTLKNYNKTRADSTKPSMMLTYSPHYMKSEESELNKLVLRKPQNRNSQLYENAMELQHNKRVIRKISSDYIKSFHIAENKFDNSIRSIEYAKTRPALTVTAYQVKNQMYQEELKKKTAEGPPAKPREGIRLPGDSPCYSRASVCSPAPSPSLATTAASFPSNDEHVEE